MLTHELREVIGSDTVRIPASRTDRTGRRRARHLCADFTVPAVQPGEEETA